MFLHSRMPFLALTIPVMCLQTWWIFVANPEAFLPSSCWIVIAWISLTSLWMADGPEIWCWQIIATKILGPLKHPLSIDSWAYQSSGFMVFCKYCPDICRFSLSYSQSQCSALLTICFISLFENWFHSSSKLIKVGVASDLQM